MSQRKRPTNLVDRFDSRQKGTFDQKPNLEGIPLPSPTRAHVPNITVYEGLEILSVLLKDYQSKFIHIEGADEFDVWFPYAWVDLSVGDEVKNLNTNAIYKISEIINTREPYRKNYVRLHGKEAPKPFHILRLDDKKIKLVNIFPAYPDTEIKPYEFDSTGHIKNDPDSPTWVDSITYTIEREAPGSRDRKPFGSNKELTPRFRETIDNVDMYNQMIETSIRFDFWTRSNANSELLREWFRDFTHKYRWLMLNNGLSQFHWTESFTAEKATSWRPGIVHRSSSYYFRTDYSIPENMFTIRDINIKVFVPTNPNDPTGEQLNINI